MLERILELAESLHPVSGGERTALEALCGAACRKIDGRLKRGVTAEDCGEAYVTAAAWLALAGLEESGQVRRFSAGDLAVEMAEGTGKSLEDRAWALLDGYIRDTEFVFRGVRG